MADPLVCVHQMLGQRDYADDPQVAALIGEARERFGDSIRAIVLYGSFTRGQRDTLLDLYVLLDDLSPLPAWQRRLGGLLPPNVYQLVTSPARAKVAVMTFDALERSVAADMAPYFWARFAQPCTLVYAADSEVPERFARLVSSAAARFVAAVAGEQVNGVPAGTLGPADFWRHAFSLTYATELRPERTSRYDALYQANAPYFDAVLEALLDTVEPSRTPWLARRLAGRTLSVLRLMKSALTFDEPVDYALWKVARHSGVKVTATERQRRYPLIFGWSLVWRLYRQGALK